MTNNASELDFVGDHGSPSSATTPAKSAGPPPAPPPDKFIDASALSKLPYFAIPEAIASKTELGPTPKLVYAFLIRMASRSGKKAYPQMRTIAIAIGLSERQAQRAIKELREHNLIETQPRFIEKRPGKKAQTSNIYNFLNSPEIQAAKRRKPRRSDDGPGDK